MSDHVLQAFSLVFQAAPLIALMAGALFGVIVGALPGLGTAVAITVCIPFTLSMDSATAIALLMGVYASSIYGGSIAAVLLNTPGTPQSACTGMEGYPMAQRGQAREALGYVTMASVLGGLISCVVLILAAPFLAALSVKHGGPFEICALICVGLACITSLSEDNQIKGIIMGLLGLVLATIGTDPLSGEMRFTFGSRQLAAGIDLMPLVIGVFPLAELFWRVYESQSQTFTAPIACHSMKLPSFADWKHRGMGLIRSALLGCGIGILPGTGATAATFIAYSAAKRFSPHGDSFGKGEPDGLIAAESSNNAVAGGALVPTLALGIPGEPVMALMMATLTLHGITPGVRLMADNPDVVYSTFILLILANVLILPAGWLCIRGFGHILRFPTAVLLSLILVCSLVGVYLPRGNMFDVWVALGIGVLAFCARVARFPVAPLLIGYVLSGQLEYRVGQTVLYKGGVSWFEYALLHPVAVALFAIALFLLIAPFIRMHKARNAVE